MSHGFPKTRAPLFRSTNFHIENRPGLEDQSIEGVIKQLSKLNTPEITPGGGGDYSKKHALAEWISDWHLLAFLATTQLLSPGDVKTLLEVASSSNLFEDLSMLDKVLRSDGWQTLTTFAKEMGCEYLDSDQLEDREWANNAPVLAPVQQTAFPSGSGSGMDEGIPPEIFDQIRESEMTSGGGIPSRMRICQYCTFENTHDGTDCEVCGLPL